MPCPPVGMDGWRLKWKGRNKPPAEHAPPRPLRDLTCWWCGCFLVASLCCVARDWDVVASAAELEGDVPRTGEPQARHCGGLMFFFQALNPHVGNWHLFVGLVCLDLERLGWEG